MNSESKTNSKKKISPGEILAGLALVTKIIEYAVKSVMPVGMGTTLEPLTGFLSFLSTAFLLAGVILWLHSSEQKLKKVDQIADQLDRLEGKALYGSTGVSVANLLGLQNGSETLAHCRAGGLTISPLLFDSIPRVVRDFYDLNSGDKDELKLKDRHMVDNFLYNLIKQIPIGSFWFGVSLLQNPEAWQKKTANMAYYNFQREVERRTENQEINYFRLLYFEDELHRENMDSIIQEQQKAKLQLRYKATASALEDTSIIWVPVKESKKAVKIKDLNFPIQELENKSNEFKPLCAIKFETRGGRDLDEMEIYSPKTSNFDRLLRNFKDNWKDARDIPEKN